MPRLSVREYEHISAVSRGIVPVGEEPAITQQVISISGSSSPSAAFNIKTRFVRVHTDVACCIDFGTNPTATQGSCELAANQTEYFGVVNATNIKIAVIASA